VTSRYICNVCALDGQPVKALPVIAGMGVSKPGNNCLRSPSTVVIAAEDARDPAAVGAMKSAHYSCNAMRRMRNAVEMQRESNRHKRHPCCVPSECWLLNQSILKKETRDE
jgi:hypothetical protein